MSGNFEGSRALPKKLKRALAALLEAFDYAQDTGSDRWEYAVAIGHLQELGLNDSDLRWLVRKGLAEHAREVTLQGVNRREFRHMGDATFSKRACFVLTEAGVSLARSAIANPGVRPDGLKSSVNGASQTPPSSLPHWDVEKRELLLDGTIVKRFRWRAVNQESILSAFQEEGWPDRIDDPLPPQPEQDSKCRLSDTIKCLNHKQINELLHFRGDGTGEGVLWERISQGTSPGNRK